MLWLGYWELGIYIPELRYAIKAVGVGLGVGSMVLVVWMLLPGYDGMNVS